MTSPHLREERLFDCYLAQRAGDRLDPPTAEHLADCQPCTARYSELATFMDELQAQGTAEADAVFTPERLRTQHQRIIERLVHAAHPARIIRFPGRRSVDFVRRSMTTSTSRGSSRWIAAAAAAPDRQPHLEERAQHRAPRVVYAPQIAAPLLTPAASRSETRTTAASDDAFLSDLEIALERPHTRELLAFDAFTPHARDVGLKR